MKDQQGKLDKIVLDEISGGMTVALFRFFDKHAIEISPTEKDKFPIESFTKMLMAEGSTDPYPFKESFAAVLKDAVDQDKALLFLVYDPEDDRTARGLCRVIGASLTLSFLKRNMDDVVRIMGDIRG